MNKHLFLIAVLALVLSSAGTATAAKLLTGKQIKNGTITLKDLSPKTVKELKKAAKAGASGANGSQGPKGDTGPAGPQGPKGDPGAPAMPRKVFQDMTTKEITGDLERTLEVTVTEPGAYIAHVNLELHAQSNTAQGECRFRAVGGSPTLLGYSGTLYLGDDAGAGFIDSRTLAYTGAFTFDAPGKTVELVCKETSGQLETMGGTLVVERVDSVVNQ